MIKSIVQFIADHNQEFYIRKIEKALGFKLYDWQKDYIFNDNINAMPKSVRNTGKTVAVITKFLLDYKNKPVNLNESLYIVRHFNNLGLSDIEILTDDPDFVPTVRLNIELIRPVYCKLNRSNLKLRKVYLK